MFYTLKFKSYDLYWMFKIYEGTHLEGQEKIIMMVVMVILMMMHTFANF